MTRQDAQASNAVVAGTLHVCSFKAYVLFDPGSTQSYVSPYFASCFGKQPVMLNHPFWVSTPMGEPLNVQLMFPSWIVSVNGVDALADLTLLEMVDFDVILSMYWLSSCHAIVDCYSKSVKFEVPDGPFSYYGETTV